MKSTMTHTLIVTDDNGYGRGSVSYSCNNLPRMEAFKARMEAKELLVAEQYRRAWRIVPFVHPEAV